MSLLRQVKAWVFDGVGNAINSTANALHIALRDGAGNSISSTSNAVHTALRDGAGNVINSTSNTLHIALHDGNGNAIGSLNGALSIHDACAHARPINMHFSQTTATATTLSAAPSAGATSITVTSATGFTVGDYIKISDTTVESTFSVITAIETNTITLDRPLDNAYSIGDDVTKVLINMNVNGSLASPQAFRIYAPLPNSELHILSFTLGILSSSAMDDSTFGSLTALTNGVLLRGYNGTTGKYTTLTSWKSNEQIKLDTGVLTYADKAPAGKYGASTTGAIKERSGAAPHVNGTAGDYLELLIQDDLSTLDAFYIKVQGHLETL